MGGVSSIWADHCSPGTASKHLLASGTSSTCVTVGDYCDEEDVSCLTAVLQCQCHQPLCIPCLDRAECHHDLLLFILTLSSGDLISRHVPVCPVCNLSSSRPPQNSSAMHNLRLQFLFMMAEKKHIAFILLAVFCPPRVTCSKCRHGAAKRSTRLGFCGDKEGRSHTVTDVGLFSLHFSDEY